MRASFKAKGAGYGVWRTEVPRPETDRLVGSRGKALRSWCICVNLELIFWSKCDTICRFVHQRAQHWTYIYFITSWLRIKGHYNPDLTPPETICTVKSNYSPLWGEDAARNDAQWCVELKLASTSALSFNTTGWSQNGCLVDKTFATSQLCRQVWQVWLSDLAQSASMSSWRDSGLTAEATTALNSIADTCQTPGRLAWVHWMSV